MEIRSVSSMKGYAEKKGDAAQVTQLYPLGAATGLVAVDLWEIQPGGQTSLQGSGEDALLAEALTTQGSILCRLGHRQEAKPILERARRVAERCGDREGAGRALLILIEEMCEQLADDE